MYSLWNKLTHSQSNTRSYLSLRDTSSVNSICVQVAALSCSSVLTYSVLSVYRWQHSRTVRRIDEHGRVTKVGGQNPRHWLDDSQYSLVLDVDRWFYLLLVRKLVQTKRTRIRTSGSNEIGHELEQLVQNKIERELERCRSVVLFFSSWGTNKNRTRIRT